MNCRTRPTPETSMRCGRELLLALAAARRAAARMPPMRSAVDVINASEPTLCAEKDNVYLKLQSAEARRFTVEAAHPAYVGTIVKDQWAPDFTNCDMSSDRSFKFEKRRADDLRDRGMAARRPDVPELLAAQPGAGARRQPRRDRIPSAPALDALSGARRGGAGALSRRRLLARASAAAAEPALERLRLVVPDRAGGDRRAGRSSTSRTWRSIRRRGPSP